MLDYGIMIKEWMIRKNTRLAQYPVVQCPGLHKGTGEESNTTAVDAHVDSVHRQSRVLDYLTYLVRRGDLTSNTNKRVLFEGETALCVRLTTASPIRISKDSPLG